MKTPALSFIKTTVEGIQTTWVIDNVQLDGLHLSLHPSKFTDSRHWYRAVIWNDAITGGLSVTFEACNPSRPLFEDEFRALFIIYLAYQGLVR